MAATVFNRASTQYVGDTTSDLFIRDVSKFPERIKRVDYPLFSTIKTGAPLSQPKLKLEWGIRHIPPVNDIVTEAMDNNPATVTVTPTNIGYYQVNHVLLFSTGEKMRVTAVGASTLTVTRAFGGSSVSTIADNSGLRIIGIAVLENADDAHGTLTQGEIDYNYFQIMTKLHQMSQRAQVTPTYESDSKDDRFMDWLQTTLEIEMPRYMEETLLWGTRSLGSTTVPSTMGGVFQSSYYSSSVDLAGDILTEYQFLEGIQKAYNIVGKQNVGKRVMSHPFFKRIAANWSRDMVRLTDDSKKRNLGVVDTYETDFGTIEWMSNHLMVDIDNPLLPDERMLIFDPDDFTLRPYSNETKWAIHAVAEAGWYKRRAVRGDYTLEAINPEKRVAFLNLSVTALDYPNFVNP